VGGGLVESWWGIGLERERKGEGGGDDGGWRR